MSKKSLNLEEAKSFYDNVICNPDRLPFLFDYDNKTINKAIDYSINKLEDELYINITYKFVIDELEIEYVTKFNKEFGECEYYAYITNISSCNSKAISNLVSLNNVFGGKEPIIRGCYGDLVKYYESYENNLEHGDMRFKQDDGRTSHIVFPYFDLCYGTGGMLIALGWAGTWDALFTTENQKTKVIAKTCLNINTILLPNEKIRTALVVLLPYNGRNEDNATNLWREWYYKYNMPKNNKQLMNPFTVCMLANDTGKKNSDGSISEDYTTWKPSIDKLVKEGLSFDYRWIDAGWYCGPDKASNKEDWWGSIGCWEEDKVKWPNNSFKEQVDYCHTLNMKTFLWFEPERVTHIEDLVKNYNYKKEWAFETPYLFYNNIGNEECFNWTYNRIISMLERNNIDMYREDNNSVNPSISWKTIDKYEENLLHIPRLGINENKCVLAHYKLWDMIIDFQIKHNRSYFVDACAGGGGRNDIESLRKGIPVMRSDLDRGTSSMRLSQSSSLCKWILFHGSSTKETDKNYNKYETPGATTYVARASYLPIFLLNEAFTQNKNLNYNQLRRNVNEWKSINHLLVKDFYRLTPYHHNTNTNSWTIFAYNDEKINESIVLAFRMENALSDTYLVKLPYVNENKNYEILDVDTNNISIINGKTLLNDGILLKLGNPKSSMLLKIKEK